MWIALAVLSCVAAWTNFSAASEMPRATSSVHRSQDDYGNYKFGYNIENGWGSSNGRWEVGDALGNKRGGYTITDAGGRKRYVEYVADKNGFRVVVNTNEPGTAPSKSGSAITKPIETADKHADENILQSLDAGGPGHLDSEQLGAEPLTSLDSPETLSTSAREHHNTYSRPVHQHHHHPQQHTNMYTDSHLDSSVASHGVQEITHRHVVHHHGDPDALASIDEPAILHRQHQNFVVAKKLKVIGHHGSPIITNAIARAPIVHVHPTEPPLAPPLKAAAPAPTVHADYQPPIVISTDAKIKSELAAPPNAAQWSAKKDLYGQYLKNKYSASLYSSGHQSVLPRQITIEHPDPVDPKTLQSLLLGGFRPDFGAEKHAEYISQLLRYHHSSSTPFTSSVSALKPIRPPPVKVTQPAALIIHQLPQPYYSNLKSSTALAQHEKLPDTLIELKTYRPHEGKAYPIHLKASESAGIPKYAKIFKRTGFGFRRYDYENEQVDPVETSSDEVRSEENGVRPVGSHQKSSLSEANTKHRKFPISESSSRNIFSYY